MKQSTRTPWKKSRTYGDIYGGRTRRRMTDNIFVRAHSLPPPGPDQTLPILIQENPSGKFHFPVSAEEFAQALGKFPDDHSKGITHIWLRRQSTRQRQESAPLAEFICGSGVRVIVIYPWRTDGKLYMGREKPNTASISTFLRFGASLQCERGRWYVHLNESNLKQFYLQHLFSHEIGHHVDRYSRRWSKANGRKVEDFADQYAVQWGQTAAVIPEN